MRLKKLRTIVAISLVVFIFIVANIVIFGTLSNKSASQNKNSNLDLGAPIYNKTTASVNSAGQAQNSNTQSSAPTAPAPSTTTTTVTHTTRTTRAS